MIFSVAATIVLAACHVQASPISSPIFDINTDLANFSIVPRDDGDLPASILTQLFKFDGCSDAEKTMVKEAFEDAIAIAASVAPTVKDVDKINPQLWATSVWWGKYDPVYPQYWTNIINNLKRMRAVKDHWRLGDIEGSRYYQIQCHNSHDIKDQFGNGCTKGSAGEPHAHTIPKATLKGKNINTYDIIVLCDAWFNDFDSFRGKVKKMETDLVYPRDNLLSLKTQAGLTFLGGMDMRLPGTRFQGRAYDPAKAKWLAHYTQGNLVPMKNVDNYVYYALWHFVMNKWSINANKPLTAWKNPPAGIRSLEGYTDYQNGNIDAAAGYDAATVNMTFVDTGGFVVYGGQACKVDSDCDGICPPELVSSCCQNACSCTYKFDPVS